MAKAKAGKRQTTRKVTLTLTEGEADLILALVTMVNGHQGKSPRKYARRIARALSDALGYGVEETDAFYLGLGNVTFFDYDDHPELNEGQRTLAWLTADSTQLHAEYYGNEDAIAAFAESYGPVLEAARDGVSS